MPEVKVNTVWKIWGGVRKKTLIVINPYGEYTHD